MEYARSYEKFLRDKLNGMATKEQKVAYLKELMVVIDSDRNTNANTKFDEQEVVSKLLNENRG